MSYDTTAAGLAAHFEKEIGTKPSVRLLTTKGTPATMYHKASESRSRGIAFVEFASSGALQAGLRLHHTELDGKRINVELTAGGGGGTDDRKQKIAERNERIGEQRKRKREADGEEDGDAQDGEAAEAGEEGSDKKKARGGRRGKKVSGLGLRSLSKSSHLTYISSILTIDWQRRNRPRTRTGRRPQKIRLGSTQGRYFCNGRKRTAASRLWWTWGTRWRWKRAESWTRWWRWR